VRAGIDDGAAFEQLRPLRHQLREWIFEALVRKVRGRVERGERLAIEWDQSRGCAVEPRGGIGDAAHGTRPRFRRVRPTIVMPRRRSPSRKRLMFVSPYVRAR